MGIGMVQMLYHISYMIQMNQTLQEQEQEHLGIWQRSNMWFFLIIIISFTIVISLKAMDNGHLRQRQKREFNIVMSGQFHTLAMYFTSFLHPRPKAFFVN